MSIVRKVYRIAWCCASTINLWGKKKGGGQLTIMAQGYVFALLVSSKVSFWSEKSSAHSVFLCLDVPTCVLQRPKHTPK